jgi:hypothetical protein
MIPSDVLNAENLVADQIRRSIPGQSFFQCRVVFTNAFAVIRRFRGLKPTRHFHPSQKGNCPLLDPWLLFLRLRWGPLYLFFTE